MSKINEALTTLLDGAWHDQSEITNRLQIDRERLRVIVQFLGEFNLIQVQEAKVRISADTKAFLESIQ